MSANAIERLREALDRLRDTEGVEDEWDAALAAVEALLEAAKAITAKQQECLENLRSHGVVFTDIGDDPTNWQHVAFTIYTDLCEAESIAAAAVRRVETGQ